MSDYILRDSGIALSTNATLTLLQVAASANKAIKVNGFAVTFDGADATVSGVLIQLLRQGSAGTASTRTPSAVDTRLEAVMASGRRGFSGEPTAGDILMEFYATPAAGGIIMQLPLGKEIMVPPSERIALRAITPATGTAPKAAAYIAFEE